METKKLITVNSLSGGKTSSYIAAHYPADYNVFALVRTNDKDCIFPDKKIRQVVSDKLGVEFIGTLEMDTIIYTMLDLEQYIGKKIDWVTGKTFDEIIERKYKDGTIKTYLPNVTMRFCTTEMKLQPIFNWWRKEINEVCEFRIGFRANEMKRAKTMNDKTNKDGNSTFKAIVGKSKTGNSNKWADIAWQKPSFPLIKYGIFKDNVEEYWKDKNVRFARFNNCVGCFHRNIANLKHLSNISENKFKWFAKQDEKSTIDYGGRTWKMGFTYNQIKKLFNQTSLFEDDDFNECDSGYCGL